MLRFFLQHGVGQGDGRAPVSQRQVKRDHAHAVRRKGELQQLRSSRLGKPPDSEMSLLRPLPASEVFVQVPAEPRGAVGGVNGEVRPLLGLCPA